MGRTSNKDNKTQYQICRENMGYSREKASEVLGWISADRRISCGAGTKLHIRLGSSIASERRNPQNSNPSL